MIYNLKPQLLQNLSLAALDVPQLEQKILVGVIGIICFRFSALSAVIIASAFANSLFDVFNLLFLDSSSSLTSPRPAIPIQIMP
jgi:Zn-dependent protease